MNRATLGAGLVLPSGVLVLGVLTMVYRINVNSSNRVLGSKGSCTMNPRKGNRKDATQKQGIGDRDHS